MNYKNLNLIDRLRNLKSYEKSTKLKADMKNF